MTENANGPSRQPPWEQGGDGEAASFGTWLRRGRELRQVSLREIADETKISIRYLEALEEDRFDVVPGAVFTRGFLRQYADYVGLDADEVVNSYLAARAAADPDEEDPVSLGIRRRPQSRTGVLLGALLVVVLLAVGALALFVDRAPRPQAVEPPPMSAPAPERSVPEPPADPLPAPEAREPAPTDAGVVAALDFQGECWVEAVADGRRTVSELRVAGESLQLEARESLRLTLGDPSAVRLEVDGRPYSLDEFPSGRPAEVVLEAAPPAGEPDVPESGSPAVVGQ